MLSGDKLKYLRCLNNKTQKQIADWCNVTTRYVGMVENGDEVLSNKTYCAWLNCIYNVGKPLPKEPKPNSKNNKTTKK